MKQNTEKTSFLPEFHSSYPTPLHIYYERRLLEDASNLETGLRKKLSKLKLFYSTKTNSLISLLKALVAKNWGLESVCSGDLHAAALAGAKESFLLLNGAAWDKNLLEIALYEKKARHLTLDSLAMTELLSSVLKAHGTPAGLSVAIRMNEGQSHFGFSYNQEQFQKVQSLLSSHSISRWGLHLHKNPAGSSSPEYMAKDFQDRAQRLISAQKIFSTAFDQAVSFLDFGGGIDSPWIYRPHPEELSKFHNPEYTEEVRNKLATHFFSLELAGELIGNAIFHTIKNTALENCETLLEPGRSVSTRALSTLVEIKSIKSNLYPSTKIAISDGNTALLGPIHRAVHPLVSLKSNLTVSERCFLYGNLPHSADWLYQAIELPKVEIGDRLLIEHTGAYFLPLESNFGLPRPAILSAEKNELLRTGESSLDPSLRDTL